MTVRYSCILAAHRATQVHFPFPAYGNKLLAEALAQAVGEGLCRAVGVCNFGGEQMAELHGLLAARGVPLASNQARPRAAHRVRCQGLRCLVRPGTASRVACDCSSERLGKVCSLLAQCGTAPRPPASPVACVRDTG